MREGLVDFLFSNFVINYIPDAFCKREVIRERFTEWSSFYNLHQLGQPTRPTHLHGQGENIQRRWARFMKADYRTTSNVTQMLQELGWQDLQGRPWDSRLALLYKVLLLSSANDLVVSGYKHQY